MSLNPHKLMDNSEQRTDFKRLPKNVDFFSSVNFDPTIYIFSWKLFLSAHRPPPPKKENNQEYNPMHTKEPTVPTACQVSLSLIFPQKQTSLRGYCGVLYRHVISRVLSLNNFSCFSTSSWACCCLCSLYFFLQVDVFHHGTKW